MRINTVFKIAAFLVMTSGVTACGPTVVRTDGNSQQALTDKWNDKDSQIVADALVEDMLSFPWITGGQDDAKPVIIIQHVSNRSHEQIPVDTFINSIKRAVLKSGKADFVVGGAERQRLREEKLDQEVFASMDSAVELGEEIAASFALSGTITSLVDQLEGKRTTTFQVDMKLINMASHREVWNGQKKIFKYSSRQRYSL
jgi:PBP1b-binding outer membrane lipoprotein LpoB